MNQEQRNISLNLLSKFNPSKLELLDSLDLLERLDTKYITHIKVLPELLNNLSTLFKVLDIDDRRIFNYLSSYYDTKDLQFYSKHHNGCSNRLKIRNRMYLDSNSSFIEIKQKSSNKTRKVRQSVDLQNQHSPLLSSSFIKSVATIDPSDLAKTLNVSYKRITLINEALQLKMTLDLDIEFSGNGFNHKLNNVLLIEVKHKNNIIDESILNIFKKFNIKKSDSFSKYCIGLILTGQAKKYNRFKPKLLALNKITGSENGFPNN